MQTYWQKFGKIVNFVQAKIDVYKQLCPPLARFPMMVALIAMCLIWLSGCVRYLPIPPSPEIQARLDKTDPPVLRNKTYRAHLLREEELESWGKTCQADKDVIRAYFQSEQSKSKVPRE